MPLINTSVPNLIQGVSQQPDATRFAGQCEEQENALSSVAEGLKKRPNTIHIARLMTEAIDTDSFVHFIDRSEDEKYVIIQSKAATADDTILRAFNVKTGGVCTINGNTSILLNSSSYLSSNSPNKTTQALTIADTTFLNNNTVIPQLTSTRSVASQDEAIVVVRQGDYDTDYVVKLSSNPIVTGSASPSPSAATFNNPLLTQLTPVSVPPRYELAAGQFGSSPTTDGSGNSTSPLTDGGEGYDANNKQIYITSNGPIDQDASIDAILGSASGNSSEIVQLDLLSGGAYQSAISSTTTFALAISWSAYISGTSANGVDNRTVTYTMTLSSASKTAYEAAGSPAVDITFTGIGFYNFFSNSGGIVEYNAATNSYRGFNTFQNVTFTNGVHTNSKSYNVSYYANDWRPFTSNGFLLSGWANQSQSQTVTVNTYVEPTITLSAGTPPSGNLVGAAEASINSSPDVRENINTNKIAEELINAFSGDTGLFYTLQDQNLLILRPISPTTQNFYVSVSDGLANTGLQLLYKEVASIHDLPVYCKDGFKIKIQGDPSLDEDDYYAEFATNDNASYGTGVWNESIGFNVKQRLDADTMPQGLINVGENEFVLGPFDGGDKTAPTYGAYTYPSWTDRTVGDVASNPFSSFVQNRPISAMTLFKNRLCLASGSNVSFSEAGQFFNFTRNTVRTLLDSAPIDVSVSSPQVTDITSCVPYQGSLLLFSDNAQLKLAGGDVLTPRTVSVTPVTRFAYQSQIEPIVLGSYMYYPFNRGEYSGLNEFTVNATTDTFDAFEVTEHVPSYIPSDVNLMASSSTEDFIVLANKGGSDMYIYVFFTSNNQKVLSSWSKFTFSGKIQGIKFIDSDLSMIMTDDHSNTHLVSLPFETGRTELNADGSSQDFVTLLDNRVEVKVSAGSNLIEFKLGDGTYSSANAAQPYTFASSGTLPEVFVDESGVTHKLKIQNYGYGAQVCLESGTATSDAIGYVGLPYTMKYKFSTQVFKAQSGNSKSPTNASKMQVRNGTVFFSGTHKFNVKVTPDGRSTATSSFYADDLAEAEQLGALKFAEGNFRFPIYSNAKHADIVIENDSPFDSKFSSAEFESFVHPRSQRYG